MHTIILIRHAQYPFRDIIAFVKVLVSLILTAERFFKGANQGANRFRVIFQGSRDHGKG
jgi:hypothetical protein